MRSVRVLAAVAAFLSGCGAEIQPGTPPGPVPAPSIGPAAAAGQGMPCAVATIVQTRCAGCHAAPPLFGAPMSLRAQADFQATAVDGRQKVWQAVKTRVEGQTMPPKSATSLTPAERDTLLAWVNQGAPGGATSEACTALPPPPGMVEPALGCQPDHVFTSSGSTPGEGFPVPPQGNVYQCFNMAVPFEPQEQAVAWGPIIGDARVVHHWILYSVKGTSPRCDQSKRFLFGWAPGGRPGTLPPDVGHELPNPDERLLLEIHYNNPRGITGILDKTGVALCTTKTPRPQEAGVITLGSVGIRIPAGARDFTVTGTCGPLQTGQLSAPLHILASSPHMHLLGTTFKTTQRAGTQPPATLVDLDKWDFNDQIAYTHDPQAAIIHAGDTLTTTCTYTNPGAQDVRFGEKTENEMCFNFVRVYPIAAAKFLDSVPLRMCASPLDAVPRPF
jgi:mono/diheme cytochrome c family protein